MQALLRSSNMSFTSHRSSMIFVVKCVSSSELEQSVRQKLMQVVKYEWSRAGRETGKMIDLQQILEVSMLAMSMSDRTTSASPVHVLGSAEAVGMLQ